MNIFQLYFKSSHDMKLKINRKTYFPNIISSEDQKLTFLYEADIKNAFQIIFIIFINIANRYISVINYSKKKEFFP